MSARWGAEGVDADTLELHRCPENLVRRFNWSTNKTRQQEKQEKYEASGEEGEDEEEETLCRSI